MHSHGIGCARVGRRRWQAAVLLMLLMLLAPASTLAGQQERPDAAMRAQFREAIKRADSFEDRFDAEVWLLDMSTRLAPTVADPGERLEILRLAHREARQARLEPELVLALIQVESNFDRFAISSAGARGLMQVMPFWLQEIGRPEDNLFQIATNLRFGCTILRLYLDREKGNLSRALARYNGSLGKHWYPDRVFKALRRRWFPQ
jgi:soluble lytic murein transglycosylase-like protein